MIQVGIHFEDDITDRLKAFGNRAVAVFDDSLKHLSKEFQGSVRRTELSGALLGGTGWYKTKYPKVTKNRMKDHSFYAWGGPLANIFEHSGGYNIAPKKGKLLHWMDRGTGQWVSARRVHGRSRPFMSTAADRFDFSSVFGVEVEKAMQKEIDKQGLK